MATRRLRTLVPLAVALVAAVWVVTASSSVPARLESARPFCAHTHFVRPPDENPRSAEVLVPMAPREVLICRYFGSSEAPGRGGTLAAERLLRQAAPTRSLAREFDDLEPYPERIFHCRRDDGAGLQLLFLYASQPDVPVRVKLSGCAGASNDRQRHEYFLSGHLRDRLEAQAPPGTP